MEKDGTNESGPAVLMTSTPTGQPASTYSGHSKVINRSTTGNHSTTGTPTAAITNTSTKRGRPSRALDSESTSDSEGEKPAVVMIDPPTMERANKRVRTGTQEAVNKTEASSTPTSSPSVRVVTTEAVTLVVATLETASLRIKSPARFLTEDEESYCTLDLKGTVEFDVDVSLNFEIKLDPGGEARVTTKGFALFVVKTTGPALFVIKEGISCKTKDYITFQGAAEGMSCFKANAAAVVRFKTEDDITFSVDASGQQEE